jgi:thiol-disulfide isomerase/thioredoxin
MPYLVAAVVLVGLLCLLDLLLTFGVIRRLRSTAEATPRPLTGPGERAGEFATVTTAGAVLTHRDLTGETVIGFFSPDCAPCAALAPAFAEFATVYQGAGRRVLAVLVGATDQHFPILDALRPVGEIVREPVTGGLVQAFGASAFPSVFVLADRTVTASGHTMDVVPAFVPAVAR